VIRRIAVRYRLVASEDDREAIDRAFEKHFMYCPVYRTLHRCIEIGATLDLVEG
jgi:uncharacterized OsmC-like protein